MDDSDEYDSEEIVVASAKISQTYFDGSDAFARSSEGQFEQLQSETDDSEASSSAGIDVDNGRIRPDYEIAYRRLSLEDALDEAGDDRLCSVLRQIYKSKR